MNRTLVLTLLLATTAAGQIGPARASGEKLAVRVGKVLVMDAERTVHDNAVVLVSSGKIEAIKADTPDAIPDGYRVLDYRNDWLLPGFIDAHNHTAGSLSDLNDPVWLTNPGLRTSDTVAAETENMKRALAGGVTSVLLLPGSATNLSGTGTVARTGGRDRTEMTLRAPGSLKIAQAGNPERWWWQPQRSYMNYNLRQTLRKAQDYRRKWEDYESGRTKTKPEVDPTWEDFRAVMAGTIPTTVHTQIYQVYVMSLMMLHDEFGMDLVTDHSTFDSYKAADLVKERDLYVIVGPRCWWMDEQDRTVNGCVARFYENGVKKLGINTDAPVVPQEDLLVQAAMAVKLGYEPYPALEALTRIPAEALGIADRVGTVTVGKDADLVIWTGDPIDPRSRVECAVVMGRVAFDADDERRYR